MTKEEEFLAKNKWLMSWWDNRKHYDSDDENFKQYTQEFKVDTPSVSSINWGNRLKVEFIRMVLAHAVFSQKTIFGEEGGIEHHLMSGFVEQVGRWPKEEDKVQLYYEHESISDRNYYGAYFLEAEDGT